MGYSAQITKLFLVRAKHEFNTILVHYLFIDHFLYVTISFIFWWGFRLNLVLKNALAACINMSI